jgi:hypothetical protein
MQVTFSDERPNEDNDYCASVDIYLEGKKIFGAGDGEPEDNTLSRNFNDIYKLVDLFEMFYQLGKENKEVDFKRD